METKSILDSEDTLEASLLDGFLAGAEPLEPDIKRLDGLKVGTGTFVMRPMADGTIIHLSARQATFRGGFFFWSRR